MKLRNINLTYNLILGTSMLLGIDYYKLREEKVLKINSGAENDFNIILINYDF